MFEILWLVQPITKRAMTNPQSLSNLPMRLAIPNLRQDFAHIGWLFARRATLLDWIIHIGGVLVRAIGA